MAGSLGGPRRLGVVLGFVAILLTHHQASAQVLGPMIAPLMAAVPTASATPGGGASAAGATAASAAAGAVPGAAMWQAMSDSLARVMADTLAFRPSNRSAADMVQSATEMLKDFGSGKNLQNMAQANPGDNLRAAVGSMASASNADLVAAYDQLRNTAKALGLALPANSPTLDMWSRIAGVLSGSGGRDLTSIMPALMAQSSHLGAANPKNMGQTAGSAFDFTFKPADFGAALANLGNLGADAFLNGPGAAISLVSLGLGLAAGITGIVGGALYIAGSAVLLGAGVDSLDTSKVKKYKDNTYMAQFEDLAREAETSLLPAALNPRSIQSVDFALQVVERTIKLAERRQ
ncbi:hypothetical protein VOLCADRAFT_96138 [Volvox carteri f. nagariensis]|uniref:Uncharacterized protein n=1 Tax=Volvox carteri f. nagariensis TaxID=3068 RepID=D8U9B2_VOLCA|nr:uncharacterized protein VOLCADRAFT_96138 [Volvox carteri f. nagariensis]EFJ43723.1 hypothetical protein VOLCADRAFT_96138 [Volvox carteri f. nagariensis]|eukprot:XP_002955204.1 hypothetical protein VOLCADRAFT_96138 [Volvox carteri f. nagariensis]